jgi:L-fuculose-phosphate aldolase
MTPQHRLLLSLARLATLPVRLRLWAFERACRNPQAIQEKLLHSIVKRQASTAFGQDHRFQHIRTIDDYRRQVPIAPYETPGGHAFANTVVPFLGNGTNTIILTNHGTVTFGKSLEDAYWKTEILDAYCRILILSKQLGKVTYLNERESVELLDLKKKLGFDDPRFHVEDCDLCGNTAFRDGYRENKLEPIAFEPPPQYAGYLERQKSGATTTEAKPAEAKPAASLDVDAESLVRLITEQVLAAMNK